MTEMEVPAWQKIPLEDAMLLLRPLKAEDFEASFAVAADPLIWEQHPARDRYQRQVFEKFFDDALAGGSAYVIIDKTTGKTIGGTRYYEYEKENSSVSIGFTFFARSYWGGVFNKSAKNLMLDNAFRFVERVYFHIGSNNIRSQTATMRFGAVKTGERQAPEDSLHYVYVVEKKDWLSR